VGLFRLMEAGFSVPPGCCVTTSAYRQALQAIGFSPLKRWRRALEREKTDRRRELEDCREAVRQADVTEFVYQAREAMNQQATPADTGWAVRSSASQEDMAQASYAGLYGTQLGLSWEQVAQGVRMVWASVWEERVMEYMIQRQNFEGPPDMAVVIQPMLHVRIAGVATSIHPVTGRGNHVTINAIPGIGRPLVDGTITPDEYTVEMQDRHPVRVVRHMPAPQQERLCLPRNGVSGERVASAETAESSLSNQELFEVAEVTKGIERMFGKPVDVEWAIENERLWLLQARPLTAVRPAFELTDDDSEWSRANFKETMPDVPSPMGISFLRYFMSTHILSHYARFGCRIPPHVSSVRVLWGRPYLNASLFHVLVGQLRGDPVLNIEQMGGELLRSPPIVQPLGLAAYLRAAWLISQEMRRALRSSPIWFAEMKGLAAQYTRDRVRHLSLDETGRRLDQLQRWLDHREVTFGIAAGVGQCLQALSRLLPRWLGDDWRSLLNASLQGQGTVISAQQIVRVAELVELARGDEAVSHALRAGWQPESYRQRLEGSPFVAALNRFIEDYGHRGLGESDVMSPRLSDRQQALLDVVKTQLEGPPQTSGDIASRQRETSGRALAMIKARCGWRIDRWLVFLWWYRRLCRFFALREANRHHLMWFSLAARNLLLRVGELLVEQGVFSVSDDIFLFTLEEREALASKPTNSLAALISARRAERERWLTMQVPDTLRRGDSQGTINSAVVDLNEPLRGIPISTGRVAGRVTFVRSTADWSRVERGDIIVAPVIDPGMAPLFGIAGGLIAEMGGTLSHGAIIAREYGLPTIANMHHAMSRLSEGESVILDAAEGCVTPLRGLGNLRTS
jgi:rifampicin phosphotransferase